MLQSVWTLQCCTYWQVTKTAKSGQDKAVGLRWWWWTWFCIGRPHFLLGSTRRLVLALVREESLCFSRARIFQNETTDETSQGAHTRKLYMWSIYLSFVGVSFAVTYIGNHIWTPANTTTNQNSISNNQHSSVITNLILVWLGLGQGLST